MRVTLWLTIALMVVGLSLIGAYLAALWTQYQPILAGFGQILAGIGVGSILGGLTLLLNFFLKYQKESKEKREQNYASTPKFSMTKFTRGYYTFLLNPQAGSVEKENV